MKNKDKYIPINKGHFFDLEPPEELKHLMINYQKVGKKNIKNTVFYGMIYLKELLEDYPLLVDLETVSRCNLSCPMCPTVTKEFVDKRVTPFKRGQIDINLAKKL